MIYKAKGERKKAEEGRDANENLQCEICGKHTCFRNLFIFIYILQITNCNYCNKRCEVSTWRRKETRTKFIPHRIYFSFIHTELNIFSASPIYHFSNSCTAPVVSSSAIDTVRTMLSTCELASPLRGDRQTPWIIQPAPWRDFVAVSDFVHSSLCADLEADPFWNCISRRCDCDAPRICIARIITVIIQIWHTYANQLWMAWLLNNSDYVLNYYSTCKL